ncbi:MAG: uroporphyrinogen-III synthase [Ktedonobacteraceae bacterium]
MPEQNLPALPLQGKHILVTRTREQAHAFSERLQALGAIPVEFPIIRIVPPSDWQALDAAIGKLFLADAQQQPYYSWLVFTSANGVHIFCQRLQSLGLNTQLLVDVRVAAIGPATAAALKGYGITADLVPAEYIAESIAATLLEDTTKRGESLQGKHILLPRAAEARKILVAELQQAGAIVDEIAAYYTLPVAGDDEQGRAILSRLDKHEIDIITFTSSSTVRNFMQWLTSYGVQGIHSPMRLVTGDQQLKIASIGPITSHTARELGLPVHIEAHEFTIEGLVEAIVKASQAANAC